MDERDRLRSEIAALKGAIRRLRSQLGQAKSRLCSLEAPESGIKIIKHSGEGGNPWPRPQPSSTSTP